MADDKKKGADPEAPSANEAEAGAKEPAKAAAEKTEKAEKADPPESAKRPSSPWPSARQGKRPEEPATSAASAASAAAAAPARADENTRAPWAAPLDRFDRAWTRLDARLCTIVLVGEVLTLVFWISMKALSTTGRGGPGLVWRSLFTAVVLGLIAHRAHPRLRPDRENERVPLTTAAVVLGLVLGRFWGDAGTAYFANFLAWMQNASVLVFFGGVSEIAKRLTLWLALLGASVATGQGKHINVDVVMRFLGPRARVPVAILGWLTAAIVSASAAWGFFDNIAVEDFHAPTSVACPGDPQKKCAAAPGQKIDKVLEDTGRNLFLAGRQLSLDVRSLPRVIAGTPYSKWLTASDWNTWVREGGWEKHFAPEDVKGLELPPDYTDFRQPAVTAVPGGTDRVHMLLVPLLNMVFPFGLLVIAIRFVIRSILAITGWVKVDPNATHGDDELAHAHDASVPVGEAQS